MPEEVTVVPMREEHIEGLVDVYLQAFHDRPSGKMGRAYARQFLRWFMNYDHGLAFAAVEGRDVLGFGVGAVLGYQKQMNRAMFWTVFWSLLPRPWLWANKDVLHNVTVRIKVALGLYKKPASAPDIHYPAPTMSYVGAGVSDKARGKRVGKKIYTAFSTTTENSGKYKAIRGTVHETNAPVNKILSGLGWKEMATDENGYVEWAKIF
ncbi:hypothetical protein KQI52_14950 [bacterium]|nr:hypothetical protein [bacterium]